MYPTEKQREGEEEVQGDLHPGHHWIRDLQLLQHIVLKFTYFTTICRARRKERRLLGRLVHGEM